MSLQIDFLVLDPEFLADVVAVKQDGVFGKTQEGGNLFIGFTFLDQVGHPDFGGG